MDDQSFAWITSLDSWEAMVLIAIIALISSGFHNRQEPKHTRPDTKVVQLSDHLGYRARLKVRPGSESKDLHEW